MTSSMRQVLAELEMLSHGSTQAWNASGSSSIPDSRILVSMGEPPHLYWRRKWVAAETDERREQVENGAREELGRWRGRTDNGRVERVAVSDAELLKVRILTEGRGWSAQDVARSLRCTTTHVRRVRLQAACDENGNPTILPPVEGVDRVRELAARGLSERQIFLLTGMAKTSIRRALKRAA